MKTVAAVAVIVVMFVATFVRIAESQTPAKPATETCTLKVSGMTCGGCEAAVRMAARSVDGVTDVKASYAKGNAEVTFDPSKTNPAAIAKVITEKSGFKAETIQPGTKK
ncbi:MAG: cation transporter [Acidobacteria bacterium]|nr:cation transporter [Acidobacteriota bacterium]MCA1652496.1 cation transporter [Acidobacteriota bacterium]